MTSEGPTILIIVRDHSLRHAAGKALAARGCHVRLASTGSKALAILRRTPVACAIVDAILEDINGLDLMQAIGVRYPTVPVIMIQGSPEIRTINIARERGAAEYLAGPLVRLRTPRRGGAGAGRGGGHGGEPGQRSAQPGPGCAVRGTTYLRGQQSQRLVPLALEALVNAMEAKDPHMVGHSIRVAELGASIAAHLGRGDRDIEEVRLAGRLHDIGMIAISDRILTKPGKLTSEEFAEVRRHPVLGHQLLVAYPTLERVALYVRGHHERWDGTGYPDGLAGDAIPWGARVLAAAEVFDALTTSRSYRSAASVMEALERMHGTSSEAVDPVVMRALQFVVYRRRTLEFIRDDETPAIESGLLREEASREEAYEGAVS